MGNEVDEMAVVDKELKVRRVKGLRVGCGSCCCTLDDQQPHAKHLLSDCKSARSSLRIDTGREFRGKQLPRQSLRNTAYNTQ